MLFRLVEMPQVTVAQGQPRLDAIRVGKEVERILGYGQATVSSSGDKIHLSVVQRYTTW